MESKSNISLEFIYPPAPSTTRGFTTVVDVNADKTKLLYCVSNLVIIRSLENMDKIEIFREHNAETTVAKFDPKGNLVCSGDVKGNVKVWNANNLSIIKKSWEPFLGGRIRDIDWAEDSSRIIAVGEGSNVFAKAAVIDTGSSLGDIIGNSRNLLTCAFKADKKPFKLGVAGEDSVINFYEGPPFKVKEVNNKSHTNFINCLRYSPDSTILVSVSADKKIVIHNAEDYTVKGEITDEPHGGTISYCDFIDSNTLITTSFDKTVKIWDLTEKKLIKKFNLKEKPEVDDSQVGGAAIKDGVLSVSLNGALNIWEGWNNLENGSYATSAKVGHKTIISKLVNSFALKTLISYDSDGRTILWRDRKGLFALGKNHIKPIVSTSLTNDQKGVFSASSDGIIKYLDIESGTFKFDVETKAYVNCIVASKSKSICYAATNKKKLYVISEGAISKEIDLGYEATAIESSNSGEILYLGDADGNIHVFNVEEGETDKLTHKAGNKITSLRISHESDIYLVSGDSIKTLFLWDLKEKKKLAEDWLFHTSSISSITFNPKNTHIVTSGMDSHAIVWSVEGRSREKMLQAIHKGGVYDVTFLDDSTFVTAGADCLMNEYKIQ